MEERQRWGNYQLFQSGSAYPLQGCCLVLRNAAVQAGLVGKTSAAGSCILVNLVYYSFYSEIWNIYNE